MAWPWSNSPAASAPAQETTPPPSQNPTQPFPPQKAEPISSNRDELADKELQYFFKEVTTAANSSSTKYVRASKAGPSGPTPIDRSSLPISEQLLPTEMSCRDAFDAAFYCNSMGGQFTNLYRYGNVRSCSESWNDFWFCMRTRTWSGPEKEEAIRSRFRDKEKAKYSRTSIDDIGRSSEDIWKSRDKKLEPGEAFSKEFMGFGDDEEWNRRVREDRKRYLQDETEVS